MSRFSCFESRPELGSNVHSDPVADAVGEELLDVRADLAARVVPAAKKGLSAGAVPSSLSRSIDAGEVRVVRGGSAERSSAMPGVGRAVGQILRAGRGGRYRRRSMQSFSSGPKRRTPPLWLPRSGSPASAWKARNRLISPVERQSGAVQTEPVHGAAEHRPSAKTLPSAPVAGPTQNRTRSRRGEVRMQRDAEQPALGHRVDRQVEHRRPDGAVLHALDASGPSEHEEVVVVED